MLFITICIFAIFYGGIVYDFMFPINNNRYIVIILNDVMCNIKNSYSGKSCLEFDSQKIRLHKKDGLVVQRIKNGNKTFLINDGLSEPIIRAHITVGPGIIQ